MGNDVVMGDVNKSKKYERKPRHWAAVSISGMACALVSFFALTLLFALGITARGNDNLVDDISILIVGASLNKQLILMSQKRPKWLVVTVGWGNDSGCIEGDIEFTDLDGCIMWPLQNTWNIKALLSLKFLRVRDGLKVLLPTNLPIILAFP